MMFNLFYNLYKVVKESPLHTTVPTNLLKYTNTVCLAGSANIQKNWRKKIYFSFC